MRQQSEIYFHNVAGLEAMSQLPGVRLHRFPQKVRHALTDKGRTKAVQSSGCELRFVTEGRYVQVMLASQEANSRVFVFKGDFFHSAHALKEGSVHTIQLEEPERFVDVDPAVLNNGAFSSKVWRIYCDRFQAVFCGIDAFGHAIRPPRLEEMPSVTLLAYGSSITQGAGALSHYNGYVQQAARRLEIDALNLGLSGACYCEPELADHIAERDDWDLAYLELGVNMRGVVPVEEFQRRSAYLLDRIIERHPEKPIFLTTIYPNRATHFRDASHAYSRDEPRYNEWLRTYAARKNHALLTLVEGERIMTDFCSLTSDLIHPSDYGHSLMGERLAALLRPAVDRLRSQASCQTTIGRGCE